MVLVSHSHRFIYIKNMKVAGTSIEAVLDKYVVQSMGSHVVSHATPKSECSNGICGGRLEIGKVDSRMDAFYNHMTATEVQRLLPLEFDCYTKVCVVRNPWDQVLSMYSWLKPKMSAHVTFSMYVQTVTESYDWDRMCVGGLFCMDYVVRYESMHGDLQSLSDMLGLKSLPPTPHYKKSEYRDGKSYKDFYDIQSRWHVAKVFHREIKLFGYAF